MSSSWGNSWGSSWADSWGPLSGIYAALQGQRATTAQGTLTPLIEIRLVGQAAAAVGGQLGVGGGAGVEVALSGLAGTVSPGALGVGLAVVLTGRGITLAQGQFAFPVEDSDISVWVRIAPADLVAWLASDLVYVTTGEEDGIAGSAVADVTVTVGNETLALRFESVESYVTSVPIEMTVRTVWGDLAVQTFIPALFVQAVEDDSEASTEEETLVA